MRLDYAFDILLERVVHYILVTLERPLSEEDGLVELTKARSRIVFQMASRRFGPNITEPLIESWAMEGAFHLLSERRVELQTTEVQFVRVLRNYLMSAFLEYGKGLEYLPS